MSRLIDADALKQHYAWWGDCGEKGKENKRLFDEIIDLQPTVGGWVSVKESLPEKNCVVLVYNPSDGVHFATFDADYRLFISRGNEIYVTHWQPLPAPPEVE